MNSRTPKNQAEDARKAKLEQALRANLRRRKAAARMRPEPSSEDGQGLATGGQLPPQVKRR